MAVPTADPDAPEFTRRHVNLADARLGAVALAASDEFFAAKERMLDPKAAVFVPGKYDANGKWMDGWETRRKRVAGHDWCVVRLARAGHVHGVDLDTSHFTDNFPPAASIDACTVAACDVPGGLDALDTASGDADLDRRDALMRRVRVVELEITTRSRRPDPDQIVEEGSGFATDEEGNLRDGFKRRTYVVHLAPRNLGVVGPAALAGAGGGVP